MTNPKLQIALDRLPQSVHATAAAIQDNHGKRQAANYLKTQLRIVDPSLEFKAKLTPTEKLAGRRADITGQKSQTQIEGIQVGSILSGSTHWIPIIWLCRAMGWNEKRVFRIGSRTDKARFEAAGYSEKILKGYCKGLKGNYNCISCSDAAALIQVWGVTHAA